MNAPGVLVKDADTQRIQIEQLAYFLWQNAGEPAGTADRDWFLAEHVVQTGAVAPSGGPE
jgi:hypothetical protein